MTVRFIDSMMGTGKTTAIINEINRDYMSKQYIYVTPFIEETQRITENCGLAQFKMPSDNMGSKTQHLLELINDKENVSISHELLKNLSITQLEKFGEYDLILDEVMDLISVYDGLSAKDLKLMLDKEYIALDEENKIYINTKGKDIFELSKYEKTAKLIKEGKLFLYGGKTVICELPLEIITAFKSVTIMSYLIEGSWLYQLLNYRNLDVVKYQIADDFSVQLWDESLANKRAKDAFKLINLYIGDGGKKDLNLKMTNVSKALSFTAQNKWTAGDKKSAGNIVRTYFRQQDSKASESLYSFFGKTIKVSSYAKSYLAYNCRATNEYADCNTLAYIIDKNNNPALKNYAKEKYNISVDEDKQALDCMLQWIFRSAIRNGESINLFLPSLKMRKLLTKWGC